MNQLKNLVRTLTAGTSFGSLEPEWCAKISDLTFECPIGLAPIHEPVLDLRSLKLSGALFIFERLNIRQHLAKCRGNNTFHPLTRGSLSESDLVDLLTGQPDTWLPNIYGNVREDEQSASNHVPQQLAVAVVQAVVVKYGEFRRSHTLEFAEDLILGKKIEYFIDSSDNSSGYAGEIHSHLSESGTTPSAQLIHDYETQLSPQEKCVFLRYVWGDSVSHGYADRYNDAKAWFRDYPGFQQELHRQPSGSTKSLTAVHRLCIQFDDVMREALGNRLVDAQCEQDPNVTIKADYLRLVEILKVRFNLNNQPHLSKSCLSATDYDKVKTAVWHVLQGSGIPEEYQDQEEMPIRASAEGTDLIACCYDGSWRVYLRTDMVQYHENGWQMTLPRCHYSRGFAERVGGWDWEEATDLADAGMPVIEKWREDLKLFTRR